MGGHFSSFIFPKHIRKSTLSSNLPGILVLESPFTDVNDQYLPGIFDNTEATQALSIFLNTGRGNYWMEPSIRE